LSFPHASLLHFSRYCRDHPRNGIRYDARPEWVDGEALSSDITLTLHPDQANAEGTLKATPGTNVAWAGFTWKEVKFFATE